MSNEIKKEEAKKDEKIAVRNADPVKCAEERDR
jgi:hypothetical protein